MMEFRITGDDAYELCTQMATLAQILDLEDQIPSVAVVSVGTIIWTAIALGAMFGFCVASALVMASHI